MNTFIESDGGYSNTHFLKRKIGNCVPRAIANALEKPYLDVWNELMDLAKESGLFPNTEKCYSEYLSRYGWKKQKPQRTKTGKLRKLKYFECKNICAIVHTRKHLVCVRDGKILDTWNPSRYKAGAYWIKERTNA